MPELPEVRGMAERLDAALTGARLERAEVLSFSGLKTFAPDPGELVGQPVVGVSSRGKFTLVELADGHRIAFHLSQGGRVDLEHPPKRTRARTSVMRLVFSNDRAVLLKEFGSERKAGWWVLGPGDSGPLEGLGPEPFDDAFSELVTRSRDGRRVHTLLRDQRTVAGIGRGFADDICHSARLSPYATLQKLSAEQRDRLVSRTRDLLEDALKAERQRTGGLPTKLGDRFRVHGRAGTPCPDCRDELRRVSYESYEVTYCPRCQTGGKVLADRRMSRLVR